MAGVIVAVFLAVGTAVCVVRNKRRRNAAQIQQQQQQQPRIAEDEFSMTAVTSKSPVVHSPQDDRYDGRLSSGDSRSHLQHPPHSVGPPPRRATRMSADEGGFECQGEKTRFATLQKQRLFAELRDTKAKNQVSTLVV